MSVVTTTYVLPSPVTGCDDCCGCAFSCPGDHAPCCDYLGTAVVSLVVGITYGGVNYPLACMALQHIGCGVYLFDSTTAVNYVTGLPMTIPHVRLRYACHNTGGANYTWLMEVTVGDADPVILDDAVEEFCHVSGVPMAGGTGDTAWTFSTADSPLTGVSEDVKYLNPFGCCSCDKACTGCVEADPDDYDGMPAHSPYSTICVQICRQGDVKTGTWALDWYNEGGTKGWRNRPCCPEMSLQTVDAADDDSLPTFGDGAGFVYSPSVCGVVLTNPPNGPGTVDCGEVERLRVLCSGCAAGDFRGGFYWVSDGTVCSCLDLSGDPFVPPDGLHLLMGPYNQAADGTSTGPCTFGGGDPPTCDTRDCGPCADQVDPKGSACIGHDCRPVYPPATPEYSSDDCNGSTCTIRGYRCLGYPGGCVEDFYYVADGVVYDTLTECNDAGCTQAGYRCIADVCSYNAAWPLPVTSPIYATAEDCADSGCGGGGGTLPGGCFACYTLDIAGMSGTGGDGCNCADLNGTWTVCWDAVDAWVGTDTICGDHFRIKLFGGVWRVFLSPFATDEVSWNLPDPWDCEVCQTATLFDVPDCTTTAATIDVCPVPPMAPMMMGLAPSPAGGARAPGSESVREKTSVSDPSHPPTLAPSRPITAARTPLPLRRTLCAHAGEKVRANCQCQERACALGHGGAAGVALLRECQSCPDYVPRPR